MLHLRTIAIVFGSLAATAVPAHAQAADVAVATSSPAAGMRYVADAADNDIRVTLSAGAFIVDDVVPIQAGAGCSAIAGGATKVRCDAPQ